MFLLLLFVFLVGFNLLDNLLKSISQMAPEPQNEHRQVQNEPVDSVREKLRSLHHSVRSVGADFHINIWVTLNDFHTTGCVTEWRPSSTFYFACVGVWKPVCRNCIWAFYKYCCSFSVILFILNEIINAIIIFHFSIQHKYYFDKQYNIHMPLHSKQILSASMNLHLCIWPVNK